MDSHTETKPETFNFSESMRLGIAFQQSTLQSELRNAQLSGLKPALTVFQIEPPHA